MKKSILGNNWTSLRKYVYPAWLIYETSIRFYDYSQTVHNFFEKHNDDITPYLGEIGAKTLGTLCSGFTFIGCSAFLTVPACLILYKFFEKDNLTGTKLEEKLKRFL